MFYTIIYTRFASHSLRPTPIDRANGACKTLFYTAYDNVYRVKFEIVSKIGGEIERVLEAA